MAVLMIFLLGIGNFAMHKAVLESGHPLLGQVPQLFRLFGGRFSLVVEFLTLLGAMVLTSGVANGVGESGWAWGYAIYTALNGVSAWLIISGRV